MIYGDNVILRPFEDSITDEDAARVWRWSRDENLLRWAGGTPTDLTLSEFREHLRGERFHAPTNRRAFFVLTNDGALIGRIGVFAIDWLNRDGEMGIVIGEPVNWGKHYGRDAIKTLVRHVFATTSLDRLYLFTFNDNVRAQRCFAACGFRTLGSARRFSPDVGEYDGVEMELTRQDFRERRFPENTNLTLRIQNERT